MGFPRGPLLSALAERILANLDQVELLATAPGSAQPITYPDTQLLISLLGVIVFPHERATKALGRLLREHRDLGRVVTVRFPETAGSGGTFEISGTDGGVELIDPASIEELPRLLRNAIAHFNILPLDAGERFIGVRVWNVNDQGKINLVADLDFDALRPLARQILSELARPTRDNLELPDPDDPLLTLPGLKATVKKKRRARAPRLSDTVWNNLLDACGGDHALAMTEISRTLRTRAADIASKRG